MGYYNRNKTCQHGIITRMHSQVYTRLAIQGLFFGLFLIQGLYGQRIINDTLTLPAVLPSGAYELQTAWTQFNAPIAFANPPGETNQLFVAERAGRIRVISDLKNNTIQGSPVLDIRTSRSVTTNGENGLLGLAFHPDYAQVRRIYVFYCHNLDGIRRNRVSSFLVNIADPITADPDSEIIYFDQVDDASNHNGGDLHFGPDGYLYVSLGDEGGADDNQNNGSGNSQRIDQDFFSGIVRIDVDKREGNPEPTSHPAIPRNNDGKANYSIPADNPLVSQWQQAGADPESDLRLEFYAIGLRNPWRMAFDNPTGRLFVGDVGQGAREEVDIIVKGGNYGWALREGFIGFNNGPGTQPPSGFTQLSDPIHDYPRGDGFSITGGVVYRGTRLPELEGAYIFGDYGSGRIWALTQNGGSWNRTQIGSYNSHYEYGIDPSNGDVLISGGDGNIRRLVRGNG
jgi:glucose/arabinose dehydrogenase